MFSESLDSLNKCKTKSGSNINVCFRCFNNCGYYDGEDSMDNDDESTILRFMLDYENRLTTELCLKCGCTAECHYKCIYGKETTTLLKQLKITNYRIKENKKENKDKLKTDLKNSVQSLTSTLKIIDDNIYELQERTMILSFSTFVKNTITFLEEYKTKMTIANNQNNNGSSKILKEFKTLNVILSKKITEMIEKGKLTIQEIDIE